MFLFFFKQKTAYEVRISDWSSDVCSSDLLEPRYNAIDARVDLELGPHHASRPGIVAGADIGERRVGTGIDAHRVAVAFEVARAMRHAAAGAADIDLLDFVGVLRDLERIFCKLHREPGAPALRSEEHTSELQSL